MPAQTLGFADKLSRILIDGHYVTPEAIEKAKTYSLAHDTDITDYLMSTGLLTKRLLGQALAEGFGVAFFDLEAKPPARETIIKIPEEIAKKMGVVLLGDDGSTVTVTSYNPSSETLMTELTKIFPGRQMIVRYSLKDDIEAMFKAYEQPLVMKIIEAIGGETVMAPEIIEQIFKDALSRQTSDIHMEPQEDEVIVRFRIDGMLHEVGRLPKATYGNILSRIKVQAHLRMDEHNVAQDGAIRLKSADGRTVDMRVSIVPTLEGETVAIRVMLAYVKSLTLQELGLSLENRQKIAEAAAKPFGMILVTGPTGSGKTTTLYALIKALNSPGVNITTIEDPVEYRIPRVNQIQVNQATNMTFAQGLKSIVRQDPNIILVGEIRDLETAEISVNAALTGHLLLSTFHANNAATAVPRLLDMGVEPFMLSSTLEVIVAQRLVRKICESCRYSYTLSDEEILREYPAVGRNLMNIRTFYRGKGCQVCGGTGYKGRVAVFEVIAVTQAMRDLIMNNPSVHQVEMLARQTGMKTIFEDGVDKVANGITTIDELLRVAMPNGKI